MYSVVLMMAMSGAPDMPAGLFRKGGCDGGCHGYVAACYGGAGCYGGTACHGGRGGLFGKKRDRGCMGGSGGCMGGMGGCMGGMGGYMGGMGGCMGGMGGCHGFAAHCGPMMPVGGCYGMPGGYQVPMPPPGGQPPRETTPPPTPTPPPMVGYAPAPATLVVTLPEDATLKIDGVATKSTTAVRQFTTPVLPVGQSFYYTLTAELVRDGQTYAATQTVTVRAGQTSQVELPTAAFGTTVAAK